MITSKQKIDSVIALAQSILATDALEQHKYGLLNGCVWMVTEMNGKYNLPYWSEGVFDLVQEHGSLQTVLKLRIPVRHEHVHTRKALVNAMLSDPSSVATILREQAIACLVTPAEHKQLKGAFTGFERYTAAGIRVWDVIEQNWLTAK